jgi:hypothetical protein
MNDLRSAFSRLSPRRRLALTLLLVLIVVTWLAVCGVLVSYLVP